jgi:hypothetical protein
MSLSKERPSKFHLGEKVNVHSRNIRHADGKNQTIIRIDIRKGYGDPTEELRSYIVVPLGISVPEEDLYRETDRNRFRGWIRNRRGPLSLRGHFVLDDDPTEEVRYRVVVPSGISVPEGGLYQFHHNVLRGSICTRIGSLSLLGRFVVQSPLVLGAAQATH